VVSYFRRPWLESRGDEHAEWGASTWYFEVSATGTVTRQLEVYEMGPARRYDAAHPKDCDGQMATEPLNLEEFASFEISAEDFTEAWSTR
jgi:hypothetical protein